MRKTVLVLCLLSLAAVWWLWPRGGDASSPLKASAPRANAVASAAGSTTPVAPRKISSLNFTNPLAFRLTNTVLTLRELALKPHAILLQNALVDTDARLDLAIPAHLKSTGRPGAYLVQARGQLNAAFRSLIASAGAQVVSYIPNNAYLVNATVAQAGALAGSPLVQVVLPFEPYYKLQPSLLGLAVTQSPLPPGTALNVGLFASDATAEAQVRKTGATIIGRDRSAFGPVLRVTPPANWTALAQLPGVQAVEPAFRRETANDLSRVTLGVSPDTTSGSTNDWLGLTGLNVLVAVNDSGIDATHPDFATGRVVGLGTNDLVDTDGHGTHVAGIIAGNGSQSLSPVNVGANAEGSITNADFRGKAPAANLFSLNYGNSDYVLQTNAAVIGALISNNSWDNGDAAYDLAASSYDAATRDALPFTTGSQPVLFVFAAGNRGGGSDNGSGGAGDTVMSPGTAKNVITVGAIEQLRNITNKVTTFYSDGTSNSVAVWLAGTDSGTQVAAYSSRGNVGIGTEGANGRFKPDVVAPGTFVISTRSSQWNTNVFMGPTTNVTVIPSPGQLVLTNLISYYSVSVPAEAVAVSISITPNAASPNPFPTNLIIYAQLSDYPDPVNAPGSIDITTHNNSLSIPPDSGGAITGIQAIQNNGFYFAVADSTNFPVNFDLTVRIYTTNSTTSDYYQVLLGMDNQLGPYYRYETGTSMSAAAVSGVLALMQDYFTNKLSLTPSPALLKALLINGARQVGGNKLGITNQISYDGWGLANLPNSLPLTTSNLNVLPNGASPSPMFFVDQSPASALATGDRHTYTLNLATNADYLPLRATLVWTDPPGDPNAAIKLVNNLDLVVTNLDTGAVYYGNDIPPNLGYSQPASTNAPPNLDNINNVKQVILPPLLAGSYSVTVLGRSVNVNAVTAHTNDTVQDFALVVSIGAGEEPAAISSVTDAGLVSQPTSGQNITFVTSTNTPLFNQFAGENTPLLGTNNLPIGTNTVWGSSGVVTLGMTNQWHFYVVTNNALDAAGSSADVTNAAVIVFNSDTLSIPRLGTLAGSTANATRPEADIDLYVSTDPSLTNLNPAVISNCLAGTVTATANSFGASLGRGGTEFVAFPNSQPGQVYYVGVKSEDHMAAEYTFLAVFTSVPFSSLDANGNQIVNGMLLPVNIPDGSNPKPGVTNVLALALYPMQMEKVTVTNLNEHENIGDLYDILSFDKNYVVLNSHSHDGSRNTFGTAPLVYDDSRNPIAGSQHTDGPGSLVDLRGKSTPGLFILNETDNKLNSTGRVSVLTMKIQPHRNLTGGGVIVSVPAHGWFIDYVDVPPGYTNLTFYGTNLPPTAVPAIQMYEKLGNEPTTADFDQRADLTNGVPPGNSISVGPPLNLGRYFIGLYNPSGSDVSVLLSATLGFGSGADNNFSFASAAPAALLDDAVSSSSIVVPNTVTQLVASVSVGMVVKTPRISDYTFTLVSPTGQRVLLMENRGGTDTNGAGMEFVYTNVINSTATGDGSPQTNHLQVDPIGGTFPITYNFYYVMDQMTVYDTTNSSLFDPNGTDLLLNTGFTNNPGGPNGPWTPETLSVSYPPGVSNVTIIMNQFGNPYSVNGDAWTYTAGAPITNYEYMVFTDDTNLSNVPIKFAPPPFSLAELSSNYTLCNFELATNGLYHGPTNIPDAFGGWTVPTNLVTVSTVFDLTNQVFVQVTNVAVMTNNQVSVVADPSDSIGDNLGTNLLALAYGTITRTIATVPGRIYNVTFWYRGPGINGWWRGEGDALDSSDPEKNANNGRLVGRFNFPAGEVGQAFGFEDSGEQFEFAGTNTYVQIPQSTSLDVGAGGGFTVEGWINPTNLFRPQPLAEWLAKVPTNAADTNFNIVAGPYLDPATGHYYYLLGATNWTVSEAWAKSLGGHLATVNTANEQNWIFDNFASLGGTNHNLWIGLTNTVGGVAAPTLKFGWSSGLTNIAYTNWLSGQPLNNNGTVRNYTFIRGVTNSPSGLWVCADNKGFTQTAPTLTNIVYGVAEVDQIQTNGVQFWVSVTNSMPGGTNTLVNSNGCLYANLIDTSNVWHEIWSAPGLLQSNVFQHVALTFDTNSGLAKLYFNGTNVATTNLFQPGGPATPIVPFVPKTGGDLLLGRDLTLYTNNYFSGRMDEMSIYSRALSDAEIAGIWRVSATATNGMTGKFDPTVVPEPGLAEATVIFGSTSNLIFGVNNQWEVNSYTFTATSNTMPLRITGLQPGMLLDDFSVSQAPLTNIYYLPEQSLNDALVGNTASGTWTMQVWDNRVGAYVTNNDLVSWQLNFILQSNALVAAALAPQTPTPSTVGPGQTVYYEVDVPAWAKWATNVLVSSTLPVNLFFNPTNLPTGANPGDLTLLTGSLGGIPAGVSTALAVNTNAPFAPYQAGTSYYLGVQNNGAQAASVVLEVDYDIMALTNGLPFTNTLATNDSVRYFSFVVTSNAYAATFQLLQLSGNADLVLRKGVPLPNLANTDYGSFNAGSADENIFVLTNASYSPVPLSAGTWYLGVIKRDSGAVNYTVLAKELDTNAPTIIDLTNAVPFSFNAGPGAALTNFFRFSITNNPALTNAHSLRFALYNLSGNGDLTVQTNALPLAPPFFESSQNVGRNPEMIWVNTNGALTNLAANWYLGVPNHEVTNLSYTIVAMIDTNGYFPAFPGAAGAGGGALGGGGPAVLGWHGTNSTVYHVFNLNDSGVGSLRDAVSSTNRVVVFDVSGSINLVTPLVITNSYLTIAGQTAPGGGITVAGQMTALQSAHDVIIRDVRFRPGGSAALPNLLNLDFNGGTGVISPKRGTAAIGYTTNDLWNLYTRDTAVSGVWKNPGTATNLLWSDGTASGINLYITNAPGAWGNGSGDYMFNNYLYPLPNGNGNIVFTLSNVPPGKYDLYLYSHGGSTENGSLNVQVGAVNYGVKTTAAGAVWSNPQVWQQGQQYVVFSGVVVSSLTDVVHVTVAPVVSNLAPINGLQMVQSSAAGIGNPGDSLQFLNASNVIADHVSAEWSPANLVSVLNSTNVTVQWSIMADSLYQTNNPPPLGSLLRYGSGVLSFNHNLYADNYSGSPRLGDNLTLDFVNNVIYNWGLFSGLSGGTNDLVANPNGCTNQLNYVCNYLIAGPDTSRFATNYAITNIAFFGGVTNSQFANWVFQTNNFIDSDTNRVLNGGNTKWGMFTNQYTKFNQPFPVISVPTDEAFMAYEKVLDFAGVNLSQRDAADTSIVTGVRQQTGTVISTPPLSGMVDWWKGENNALDSVGANNGTLMGGGGYTNGVVGRAFNLNGTNAYVLIPNSPSLNSFVSAITIETWIKVNLFDQPYQAIVNKGNSSWRLQRDSYIASHGGHTLQFGASGLSNFHVEGSKVVDDGQWHHVAATYDGAKLCIYVDGVLDVSAPATGAITQNNYPLCIGANAEYPSPVGAFFNGLIDEVSLYKRALSSTEIAAIYSAGSAGKFASLTAVQPYLDSDQDGIPDFWEKTFGQNPLVPSSNDFSTNAAAIGYTTLEEYINWLAVPHAVAVTNTPVGVDLYQMSGNSGSLGFFVTNAVNGTVYLTNVLGSVTNTGPLSNSFAVFTPNPNYSGYASFDYYVTNTDTEGYFGPVTVSVVVSAVPITFGLNTNPPPTFLTNTPPDQTINELVPLTVTNSAVDANTNVMLTYSLTTTIDTNAMNLLGWVNAFANVTNPPPAINTNGVITWTPSEAQGPGVYLLTTTVSDNGVPPKTAVNTFKVTVNETNTAPFWPPNVPGPTNYTIVVTTTLSVTNTAQDLDVPNNALTYTLLSSPVAIGAVISTNGIFTWTPNPAQLGLFTFTTIVTDTNPPAVNAKSLSATNVFTVLVRPVALPFVFSQPAQLVTGAGALLPGMVTPNGLPTTAWFEWGTTTNYGNVTPVANLGAAFNVFYTNSAIGGLLANVAYHFRLVAANAAGTNYGFDQILDEANVVVWGANFLGQADYAQLGLSNVTAIAGAYDHNLALKNNGTAVGWGDNTFGQMAVPAGLNNNLVAVAGGQSYSLALKNTGAVVAWGANIFPGETNVPAAALNGVVLIASGQYSSTALKNTGSIVAWGANISGLTTVPVGLNNSAVAIAGGSFHNLAIRNDGTVVAWGDDSAGQTDVPADLTNVVAVSGGSFHSLALKSDGTVVAWGDNSSGQTNVPAALNHVVAIAAGGFHSVALKSDGTVVTWGDGSAGQKDVPAGLTNFVAIAAGNLHSLALTPQSIASLTNVVLSLTNGVAQTNSILPGGITYYRIGVPVNADFATNLLLFADARLNVWFTTNTPPTIAAINDSLLFAGATNGLAILSPTSAPTNIVPGATYYLGVQNTNSSTVFYGIEVDFHLTPLVVSPVTFTSIIYTNIAGTNGFLLTWFAPSNDLFQVQWAPSLPPVWTTFTNPPSVSFNPNFPASATNAQFNFFDDASQTGGSFGTNRFYRLLLLTNAPVVPSVSILPYAATLTAKAVTGTSAILNGFATPNGAPTTAWFEWGASRYYGSATAPVSVGSGSNVVFVTNSIIGLAPALPYHFRLVVSNAVGIVRGYDHVFGVGSVIAWGDGSLGDTNVPSGLTNAVAVAGGQNLSVALKADGTVIAWGSNLNGETNVPVGLSNVVAIAAGNAYALALKADGTVTGWGTLGNSVRYAYYAGLTNIADISLGSWDNAAALTRDGRVLLYDSALTNSSATGINAVAITSGFYFNEGVANDGSIFQIPAYTNTVPPPWTNMVALSMAFNNHMVGLQGNGTILDWTNFSFSSYASVPPTGTNFETVAASGDCGMALDFSGSVHVWGDNPVETNLPAGLTNVIAIAAGNSHSLAIQSASSAPLVVPTITSVSAGTNGAPLSATNGLTLQWSAPVYEAFQVQWATNLNPVINWFTFPNDVTSTTGAFFFTDTNAPYSVKFYRLILLP